MRVGVFIFTSQSPRGVLAPKMLQIIYLYITENWIQCSKFWRIVKIGESPKYWRILKNVPIFWRMRQFFGESPIFWSIWTCGLIKLYYNFFLGS